MLAKYQRILNALQHQILEGRFANNHRLPSETELGIRYKVSRPTAARALAELENQGIIIRRAGSGSYLRPASQPEEVVRGKRFGLLVPGLGKTEILDPICTEITRFAQSRDCTVLWGDAAQPIGVGQDAVALCQHYIESKVDGVFFAPMELVPERAFWNVQVANALSAAGIPFVLLDRDLLEFPQRSTHDMVGIDNFRAGAIMAEHLVEKGARRICFLAKPNYPSTTDLRASGCREAVRRSRGVSFCTACKDPADSASIQALLRQHEPDAIVCANDQTAALLLSSLVALRVKIPATLRIAGFDDVQYATLLSVPLTTIRQPCRDIARAATLALLDRTVHPTSPPRQILLPFELIVRRSTGRIGP